MNKVVNEVGNKHGQLTVIERSGSDVRGRATWLCECKCGKATVVVGLNLRSGNTRSCGCSRYLPEGEAAFNRILNNKKQDAKRRKYKWQLTKEQVQTLTRQPCYYCGEEPNQGNWSSIPNGVYLYNGLDRVDNDRGYTIDNVVSCCRNCNVAKGTKTTEEFKLWIRNIYEHFAK